MTKIYPNIFSTKILIDFNRQEFYKALVTDHKNLLAQNYYKRTRNNNFFMDAKYNNLVKYLYNIFLNKCEDLFGKLELSCRNRKVAWALVTNKNEHRGNIHNHIKTSTINSVYYLNVPLNKSCGIGFYDDNNKAIYTHQPANDELIIFPNYLKHKTLVSNTEEYRIAINLEIICNNVWEIRYNL
jgi:hypothetical protein